MIIAHARVGCLEHIYYTVSEHQTSALLFSLTLCRPTRFPFLFKCASLKQDFVLEVEVAPHRLPLAVRHILMNSSCFTLIITNYVMTEKHGHIELNFSF